MTALSVQYAGDTSNTAATSATASINFATATTSTTALTASVATVAQGNPVTFTATITGSSPTGSVAFLKGSTVLGVANVVNGTATLTLNNLPAGASQAITASYSGDSVNTTSLSSSTSVTVNAAPATLALSSANASVQANTPAVFTVKVSGANANVLPTGSVTFYDGTTSLGSIPLVNGYATLAVNTLGAGNHRITVQYAGDTNNAASTSAVVNQTVVAVPVGVSLSSSASSISAGSQVNLTANISGLRDLSSIGPVTTAGLIVSGNSVTQTAAYTGNFDNSIRSTVGYTGGASVSFKVPNASSDFGIGLNTDPATDNSYTSMDWCLYYASGTLYAEEFTPQGGSTIVNIGSATPSDILGVSYDGTTIRYWKNGAVLRSVAATITQPLYLDSAFRGANSQVNIQGFSGAPTPVSSGNTGAVTFYDGQTALGTAAIVGGAATLSTNALTLVGNANITAVYSGDGYNASANSAASSINVTPGVGIPATTTTLTSSAASTFAGQSVSFTATIAGGTNGTPPTGLVTFFNEAGAILGSAAVVNGQAVLTIANMPMTGVASVKATYSGDASAASSSSNTVAETVGKAAPAVSMAYSMSAQTASGTAVSITARIAGAKPSGTATLYNNGVAVGSPITLVNGLAIFSATLPAGKAKFTITYTGDANNQGATSSAVDVNIQSTSSIAWQSATPANPSYGTPVTLKANVTNVNTGAVGTAGFPAGTLSFFSGNVLLGTATCTSTGANSSTATLTTSLLPVGANSIRVVYSGDALHAGYSLDAAGSVTVGGVNTTTSLTAAHAQSAYGSDLTLSALVSSAIDFSAIATGRVSFYNDTTLLGTVDVVNGRANFTTASLPLGTTKLKAVYDGSTSYPTSSSAVVTTTVFAGTTSTVLEVSPSPSGPTAPITLTAQVSGVNLSGKVTFYNGATVLGEATVTGNVASLVVGSLPLGRHSLKAVYGNDANHVNSSSAIVYQTVQMSAASLSRSSAATTTQSDTIAINVVGANNGSVTLFHGTTVVATAQVVNGVALLSASQLPVGNLNLTASYSGNANFQATTLQFNQTVQAGLAATAIALNARKVTGPTGKSIQLNASVAGSNPTGTLTFYNGGTQLGSPVALTYGMASITLPITTALDNVTAVYSGDSLNATSTTSSSFGAVVVHTVANAADRVLTQVHDKDGLLRATIDGEGYLTEFRYNAAAQQTQSIRYANKVPGFTSANSIAGLLASVRAGADLSALLPGADVKDAKAFTFYDAQGLMVGQVDERGFLTEKVYDVNGNVTQTIRYANPALTPVAANSSLSALRPAANTQDQVTNSQYNTANRLVSQTNAEGTVSAFSYDRMGNLASTTTALNTQDQRTLTAQYDIQNRLVGELSAEGHAALQNLNSPSAAQVEQLWADFGLTHAYDAAGRRTSTTDQNGNKSLFFYDANGRLTDTINALGEVSEQRYDALGQLSATTQYGTRLSAATLSSLVGAGGGLVTSAVKTAINTLMDAAKDSTTRYTYTTTGTLAQRTDALGNTLTMGYNAFAEATSTLQNIGNGQSVRNTTSYDRRGLQVNAVGDAGGINTSATTQYDAFGRVVAFTDANGNTTSYDYQDNGRTLVVTDPQSIAGESATQRRTTYDAFNRVLTQTEDAGRRDLTTRYTYDQATRSVTVTTPEGISVSTHRTRQGQTLSVTDGKQNTTTYAYDKNGNLTATNAPLSSSTQSYDRASRLVETVDANGHALHITYDAANRVASRIVDPNGLNLITRYAYTAKGEQLSVTDPVGNVTAFTYNLKGELKTQTVDPTGLNLVTQFDYDGRGKTVRMTDAVGNVTVYTYDKLGRRTSEVQDPTGLNIVKNYSYDANGNVVKVEIPLDNTAEYAYAHNHVTRYAYDANNRLRFTLVDSSDGIAAGGKVNVSENVYNSAGRLVKTIQHAKTLSVTEVTAWSNAHPNASVTELLEVMAGATAGLADYTSDRVQYYRYDDDGRLTATAVAVGDGNANVTAYVHDANGNITKRTAFVNTLANFDIDNTTLPVPTPGRDNTTYTAYDAHNRAIYVADGTLAPTALRYDNTGNLIERTVYAHRLGSSGTAGLPVIADDMTHAQIDQHLAAIADPASDLRTTYIYDAANRLSHSANSAGQAFQHLYDANGNVLQTTQFANGLGNYQVSGSDHVSRKVYDAANRLTRSVDPTGAVTDFVYDKTGNVLRSTQYAQPISGYANAIGGSSLVAISTPTANGANDRVTRYGYDHAGRQTVVVNAEGEVTQYERNALGLVTNLTQYASKASATALNAMDAAAAVGTPLTSNDIVGYMGTSDQDRVTRQRYDAAGQLEFVVDAEGYVTRYRRDGIGQMVEQTRFEVRFDNNQQSGFFTDSARGVTGNAVTDFGYDAAGQLVLRTDALENTQAFSFDGAGNKTSFTNEKGSTWNYDYDAAGHLIRETAPEVEVVITDGGDASGLSIDPNKPVPSVRLVTALAYDARGNVLSRTEAAGLAGQERTTKYTYDSLDRQISTIFAAVGVYNESPSQLLANSGQVTRQETALQALTTTIAYDVLGNAYLGTDAAGNISTKTYDKAGRVVQETDAAGNTTTYQRTVFGDVSSVIRRAAGGGQSRQIDTYYDRMGRAVTVQNESVSGVVTDSQGNATAYQGVRPTTQKTYNAFGELTVQSEVRDPVGQTTLKTYFQYDKLGQQVGKIDAAGYLTARSFDARGNVLAQTEFAKALTGWTGSLPNATLDDLVPFGFVPDPTNDRPTEYKYDLLNRKTQQTEVNLRYTTVNNDGSLGSTATGVSTKYEYDKVGNLTKTIDQQSGAVTQSVYDSLGRTTAVKAPK